MEEATATKLLELNREFYRRTAEEFSRSRQKLQPGLLRALDLVTDRRRLLDLGCGDGRFGRAWVGGSEASRSYVGADVCDALLEQGAFGASMQAVHCDLLDQSWPAEWFERPFDAVVSFSVLHHLPTSSRRQAFLKSLQGVLSEDGVWILSVWQVLHRPRFRRRLVDWAEIGLREAEVDPGDLLIDWRRGTRALRYVHHFEEEELRSLCEGAGLEVDHSWRSDGDSGDLGLYLLGHRRG